VTGPETARRVYTGRLFDVAVESWSGREREIVQHPGSAAIVAIDPDGYVTFVRQLREPARKRLIELPAGTLEAGEEPLACAKRELEEEVGLAGGQWRELGSFFTTPGFCNERMHVFLAEGVERRQAHPESDEDVEVVIWPVSEVANRVGELEDAKTIAGLLLYLAERAVTVRAT
jgi:ADP-ribose pyrophosphatase